MAFPVATTTARWRAPGGRGRPASPRVSGRTRHSNLDPVRELLEAERCDVIFVKSEEVTDLVQDRHRELGPGVRAESRRLIPR